MVSVALGEGGPKILRDVMSMESLSGAIKNDRIGETSLNIESDDWLVVIDVQQIMCLILAFMGVVPAC